MTTSPELLTLTNVDRRFYPLIGPFLGRREVHRAIGSAVYDDDDKTWIIARKGRRVTGFIAYRAQRGVIAAESCYIARRNGDHEDPAVRETLLQKLIEVSHPSPLTAMVPNEVTDVYTELGFTELPPKSTKNFTYLIRNAA
ncbi:hypothetical protein [Mycobacterium sp. 155]|uniref:hypothetical protein n=1 Tax=Mycobacterium sp. 155 TaxID=1157943 RepID=UPI000365B6B4|nr:hypothetical protein [Mycobacterium sp. 155]